MGSSGYGSYGSNGSHEQQVSVSSSSESNGNLPAGNTAEETSNTKPSRTFQEICKGVHMLKNQDSQVCLRSSSPWPPKNEHRKTTDGESACSNRGHVNKSVTAGMAASVASFCSASSAAQRSSAVRLKDSTPQVRDGTAGSMEDFPCKDQTVCSYQQISCLDSVIRSVFFNHK